MADFIFEKIGCKKYEKINARPLEGEKVAMILTKVEISVSKRCCDLYEFRKTYKDLVWHYNILFVEGN